MINNTILRIIKEHIEFSESINQYKIADEYELRRGEAITPRRVRLIIEDLIEEGYPIISTPHNPGGYCWGSDETEALECYKRLRHKGIMVLVRARKLRRNCLAEKARRVKQEQMNLPYKQLERGG